MARSSAAIDARVVAATVMKAPSEAAVSWSPKTIRRPLQAGARARQLAGFGVRYYARKRPQAGDEKGPEKAVRSRRGRHHRHLRHVRYDRCDPPNPREL